MRKRLITATGVVSTFAALAISAMPAAAAPASPGACNMLNVSATGMDGMFKASDRGLANMMNLVIASETYGCRP